MNRRKHDPYMVSYYKMLSEKYMGQGNPMYGKKTSEKQKNGIRKAHMEGKIVLSEEGRLKIIETNRKQKGIKNINKRNDSKKYDLTSPLGENYAILGAVDLQKFCKENKLQYHVLKNNTGLITENMIIGKKINAKNTIGWKKN